VRLLLLFVALLAFSAAVYLGYDRGAADVTTLVTIAAGVVALVAFQLSPRPSWQTTAPRIVNLAGERRRELSTLEGNLAALADAKESRPPRAVSGRSSVRVRLTSTGPAQIAVIKALRSELKLGLKQAKQFTDSAEHGQRPVVAEDLAIDRAMRLARSVEAAGGRVELE